MENLDTIVMFYFSRIKFIWGRGTGEAMTKSFVESNKGSGNRRHMRRYILILCLGTHSTGSSQSLAIFVGQGNGLTKNPHLPKVALIQSHTPTQQGIQGSAELT
jgi:hypothetical protein